VLAPLLRFGLALQVVLGLWIGFRVAGSMQVSAWWSLPVAVAAVLALQFAVTTASFALAIPFRHAKAAGVRLGPLRASRLFLREYIALTALYVLFQPFEMWFVRHPKRASADGALPVILIHGIYCNAASWWWMHRRLAASVSNPIHLLDVEPPWGSIDEFARQLARCIERVCADTGAQQVVLVGHSMGGMVSRACLTLPGIAHRVVKVVTIGSPHHGSRHARLGFGADARELVWGSDWMQRLNGTPASTAVPIVSIYSRHDNFVAPQESCVLTAARMVPLDGVGHLSMLFSREVAGVVVEEIRDLNGVTGDW
jgi:triacylglycerol lipase